MHAHIQKVSAVIAFAAVAAAAPATDGLLEPRAGCNADNVLRALQATQNTRDAGLFCYSLLPLLRGPTTTFVTAAVTPAPVIVTTTATVSQGSIYPNGLYLEELPYPTYISRYPAPRVSSACSCFLASERSTITVTATGPTATTTVFSLSPTTLSGICATAIEYPGAYALLGYSRNQAVTTIPIGLSNAYDCCNRCQVFNSPSPNFGSRACLAYLNVPGVSCNLLYANVPNQFECKTAAGTGGILVASSSVPNNLGGRGPCASTIIVGS